MRHRLLCIAAFCAILTGCSSSSGGGSAPPAPPGNSQPDVSATGIVGAAGSSTSGEKAPLSGAAQPVRAPSGPALKLPAVHFQAPHISVHLHH